jgi:hypothetical protein
MSEDKPIVTKNNSLKESQEEKRDTIDDDAYSDEEEK